MDCSVIGRNEVCLRFLCSKEKRRRILLIKRVQTHTCVIFFYAAPLLSLIVLNNYCSCDEKRKYSKCSYCLNCRAACSTRQHLVLCIFAEKKEIIVFLFKLRIDYRYRDLFFCTTLLFLISKRFSRVLKLTSSFFFNILKLGLFARLMPTF